VESRNDEKHMFFGGVQAVERLKIVLVDLLEIFCSQDGARSRIFVVPCDFMGTSVYRFETQTELCGELFWQHLSRLRRELRAIDDACPESDSFTYTAVASDELFSEIDQVIMQPRVDDRVDSVDTEIGQLHHLTRVRSLFLRP